MFVSHDVPSEPRGWIVERDSVSDRKHGGRTDKRIAFELHASVETAFDHFGNVLRKFAAGNRTEGARYALDHGPAQQAARPSDLRELPQT